jgi:orotate phosphoribosyltransferase
MNPASKLAQYLLEIKAVKLQPARPFKWSSGWNSPVYCDNRVTLSYPHIRTFIKNEMAEMIKSKFPDATAICGVATAGIAIGALVADVLEMPFAYCRPKPKEHGLKNQLEGSLDPNAKVVVIEDLISTGGSSIKVVEYLRSEGYHVLGLAAIFNYGFPIAASNFSKANCPFIQLGDFEEAIKLAASTGYVKEEDLSALNAWRKSPETWPG